MQTHAISSNLTTFLLPSHASSNSSLEHTDDHDEEPTSLDNEPLLPQHQGDTMPRTRRVKWPTCWDNRPLKLALGGLTFAATATFLWLILHQLSSTKELPRLSSAISSMADLNETRQFLSNLATTNEGYIPFPSSAFSPLYTPLPLQHTLSTSFFPSHACLAQFVAQGEICEEMRNRWIAIEDQPKLHLIWTWTNGSRGELLAEWKDKASLDVGKLGMRILKRVNRLLGGNMPKHFREHDELRFSIRSVLASLPSASIANLHLVVGDTPSHAPEGIIGTSLLDLKAQVPHWLNLSTVEFASSSSNSLPAFQIHPHSEFFKMKTRDEEDAMRWRDSVLPSFNSLAIESQLANLEINSSTAVYLNDDFFLNQPLSVADFESLLTGPVFRMQRDLLVGGVDPTDERADPDSEWKSLGTAGHLLNRRFGVRKRPYLVHIAKAVSMPMLRELQAVFIDELTQTAEARFRGRAVVEAQTMHLLAHYTIEKHREALLWSFLVARSNPSASGFYSALERVLLLKDLGYDFSTSGTSSTSVYSPRRLSLSRLPQSFESTGLPRPQETTFTFTSQDGYAYFGLEATVGTPEYKTGWPSFSSETATQLEDENQEPICKLELDVCFGSDFLNTMDQAPVPVDTIFKRIAFKLPSCGDCLIAKLVGSSGERGLEAFLPRATDEEILAAPSGEIEVATVGLEGTSWSEVRYEMPMNVTSRAFAISLIQRYSYSIGSSSAAFRSIKGGGEPLSEMLEALSLSDDHHHPSAFLALNDDIYSPRLTVAVDVNKRLGEWFRKVWPSESKWELAR